MTETRPCFLCGETGCPCWDVCRCGDYRSEHDPITRRSLYNAQCWGFEADKDKAVPVLAVGGDTASG
jgi:hypothetical protein